jgi:hypothetical protein
MEPTALSQYHGDPNRLHDPGYRQRLIRDAVSLKEVRTCVNLCGCIMGVGVIMMVFMGILMLFDHQLEYDNLYLLGETPVVVHSVNMASASIIMCVLMVIFTGVVMCVAMDACSLAQGFGDAAVSAMTPRELRVMVREKHDLKGNPAFRRRWDWCAAFIVLSCIALGMLFAGVVINEPAFDIDESAVIDLWDVAIVGPRERDAVLAELPMMGDICTANHLLLTAPAGARLPWGAMCAELALGDHNGDDVHVCCAFSKRPGDVSAVRRMKAAYITVLSIIAVLPLVWFVSMALMGNMFVRKPLYITRDDFEIARGHFLRMSMLRRMMLRSRRPGALRVTRLSSSIAPGPVASADYVTESSVELQRMDHTD